MELTKIHDERTLERLKSERSIFADCSQLTSIPSKLFDKFWKLLEEVYKPMAKTEGLDKAFEYVYDTRYDEGFKNGARSIEWKYEELFKSYPWYVKLALWINKRK